MRALRPKEVQLPELWRGTAMTRKRPFPIDLDTGLEYAETKADKQAAEQRRMQLVVELRKRTSRIKDVAVELGLSERTVYRILQEAGRERSRDE